MATFSIAGDIDLSVRCETSEEALKLAKKMIRFMDRIGVRVARDAKHDRQYPSLASRYRILQIESLDGTMNFSGGRIIEIDFFQADRFDNPNGAKYDFRPERLRNMQYRTHLRHVWLLHKLQNFLARCGVMDETKPKDDWIRYPLAAFNQWWQSHRFERGEDGWPTESELRPWRRTDGDGIVIRQGDSKYICRYGRWVRTRVYGGINGMWMCVAPGIRSQESASSLRTIFPGRGRHFDPKKAADKIRRRIKAAIEAEDFLLAHRLKAAISNLRYESEKLVVTSP